MTAPTPTTRVTCFEVSCVPETIPDADAWAVRVEYWGHDVWAVTVRGRHLDADGNLSYGYSWRDGAQSPETDDECRECQEGQDAWTAAHRFPLSEALRIAERHAPLMRVNGYTVDDVLRMGAER